MKIIFFSKFLKNFSNNEVKRLKDYKIAFTLAEVLITLGIIGVVASLTLPMLIGNYKEKVFVTSAKKNYSIVLNAVNKESSDSGVIGDYSDLWISNSNSTDILSKITSHMNVAKFCTVANLKSCGGNYNTKLYKKINDGNGQNTFFYWFYYKDRAVLADGTFISVFSEVQNGSCTHKFWSNETDASGNYTPEASSPSGYKGKYMYSGNCGYIYIDTNGLKGPNQIGIDTFAIGFSPNYINANDVTRGNINYVLLNDKLIQTENYTAGEYK